MIGMPDDVLPPTERRVRHLAHITELRTHHTPPILRKQFTTGASY
eukprot:SAG11_NODE_9977_length_865_cov_0.740209_1_plen_44_part_10